MPIRKKNPSDAASVISESGFVCIYFLVLFLLCTAIITVLMNAVQDRTRTAINVRTADELLAQESAVMCFIKCELKNERLADSSYEQAGVSFSVVRHGDRIDAVIHSPKSELLQITLEDETHVYDYDVIRSETPA